MNELVDGLFLNPGVAVYAVLAVLVAGIVRGFTGFGMSAIIVLALSMILPPAEVVPMVMPMEIAASIRMLPGVWREVNWKMAVWLLAGSAIGTPFGAALLLHAPVSVMRTGLSLFVLCMATLLWRGFRLPGNPRPAWGLAAGLFSGTANGAASFGGQPTALFLLSTSVSAATARATLVFMALCTDLYGSAVFAVNGLLTVEILMRAGLLLIPMALGIALGSRRFAGARPETYRRAALGLLAALAIIGLVRAALG